MKQKLFENVGGNTFKLITESVDEVNPNTKFVREGLKKVFGEGSKSLSYKKLQGVGLGYIKNVEEAKKTAIQEARVLAKEYGYMEDENSQRFVKEDETDMSNTAEAREVQIGKEILRFIGYINNGIRHNKPQDMEENLIRISELAKELIIMHGQT